MNSTPQNEFTSTAMMKSMSIDTIPIQMTPDLNSLPSLPDIMVSTEQYTSLKFRPSLNCRSFPLLDANEHLKVSNSKFVSKLGCANGKTRVKVVAIVGNSGDGKSHTLNELFFNGEEVFKTSSEQRSCTMGVWAAFDPNLNVIVLDTEGLLGNTDYSHKRTRILLKVLAISDIVLYRTRAERLTSDMYEFLGSASKAFNQHFQKALSKVNSRGGLGVTASMLGPAVLIFHETCHTDPLSGSSTETRDYLATRFAELKLSPDAFSSLRYVGTRTVKQPTDFSEIRKAVFLELTNNNSMRSPRPAEVVYQALQVLNEKFSGEITGPQLVFFRDEYFTCASKCLSCDRRCEESMGHTLERLPHVCKELCCFQAQYNNKRYVCKLCLKNGQRVIVKESEPTWLGVAKQAWGGYTIDCPHCGVIYQSRQYWYGNKEPEDSAVLTENTHVWQESEIQVSGAQNTAQKVLDGVAFLSDAVASVGSQPTNYVRSWMADQVAPKYWRPNHEITKCFKCKEVFTPTIKIHHCRACGEGFCTNCSSNEREVPERGWLFPVRVCDTCYPLAKENPDAVENPVDDQEVRARKYSEVVVNTITTMASVLEYPKVLIKDSARPSYWVPDNEATHCVICKQPFGPLLDIHHCRACGQAVCHMHSDNLRPVPGRGWENPVRVCDNCVKIE